MPGIVAGLHMAWKEAGSKPWKDLVQPAVVLARDGFEVSQGLARSLAGMIDDQAKKRGVVKGTYRGYDVIGMPPPCRRAAADPDREEIGV